MTTSATSGATHLSRDQHLRAPPSHFQRQRSREEIELAESLLDHSQAARDGARPYHEPTPSMSYTAPHDDRRLPPPQEHREYQQSRCMNGATSTAPPRAAPSSHPPDSQSASSPSAAAQSSSPTVAGQVCSNCGTTRTPLWRRSNTGQTICNACGLYLKARNTARPPNLKRPPSYAPAFPADSQGQSPDPSCGAHGSTDHQLAGSCPGGGKCNGTGGHAACDGCPALNNRVSKTAQIALTQQSQRTSPASTSQEASGLQDQHAPVPNVGDAMIACQNCRTTTTPLWRRDPQGHTICNACGLYYKLHNQHRPVEMKKSYIKRRKRVMPAHAGQDSLQNKSDGTSVSPNHSTSPPSYATSETHGYSQSSQARNSGTNIDPTLERNFFPPPVDFTDYVQGPQPPRPASRQKSRSPYPPEMQPSPQQVSHNHDHSNYPPHPHPSSPKRRRVSPDVSLDPVPLASNPGHAPQRSTQSLRTIPITVSHPSAQTQKSNGRMTVNADSDSEEAVKRKRMKRDILRQQILAMQREMEGLGSDDENEAPPRNASK